MKTIQNTIFPNHPAGLSVPSYFIIQKGMKGMRLLYFHKQGDIIFMKTVSRSSSCRSNWEGHLLAGEQSGWETTRFEERFTVFVNIETKEL